MALIGLGVSLGVEQGELTCVTAARPVPGPLGGLGLTARARACARTGGCRDDCGSACAGGKCCL